MGKVDSERECDIAGEQRGGFRGECAGKGQAYRRGGETESPQSMHVITSPLNSCQGPSAAVILIKCSWCYEQSAWRITSWITTQKAWKCANLGVSVTFPPSKQLTPIFPCIHGTQYDAPHHVHSGNVHTSGVCKLWVVGLTFEL